MAERAPPSHLLTRAGRGATDDVASGLGVNAPPYVSIKGNRFTLVDAAGTKIPVNTFDPQSGPYIDVIILAGNKNTSRIFYAHDFDPSALEFQPPDCWSDNGIAPSVNAMTPQHPTCATCPQAEWGAETSKQTGRGIPACGAYKKMAVLMADPDLAGDMPFLIRVPPNSLKPLRTYVQQVAKVKLGDRMLDTPDIITRISFKPDELGTLMFKAMDYVDPETMEVSDKILQDTTSLDILLGRNDRPRTAAIAPPARGPEIPASSRGPAIPAQPGQRLVEQEQTQQAPQQGAPTRRGRGRPAAAEGDQQKAPARRGRGRPATVAESPKAEAQSAGFLQGNGQQQERAPFQQQQPAGNVQHGVATNVEAPSAQLGAELDTLFGKGK